MNKIEITEAGSITLNNLSSAKELIQKATVSQLKEVIGRAEALRVYAAQAKKGLEIQNQCAEIKLRAERRIGEQLKDMPKKQGDPNSNKVKESVSLKELGIEHIQSHRWQAVASLPEKEFERHMAEVKKSNEELTTVGVIRLAREISRKDGGSFKKKEIPEGEFNVILCDAPWKYNDKHDYNGTTGAETHYPSMSIEELCEMKIPSAKNAILFFWVTSPLLEECFAVINAWGFQYKTSFVWDKVKHNMGHYNSVRHEFLLVCTKGSFTPEVPKLFDSVIQEERSNRHSEKPEIVYDIIEKLYPSGKYLELFGRKKRAQWITFGNEVA